VRLEVVPASVVVGDAERFAGAMLCREVASGGGEPLLPKGHVLTGRDISDVVSAAAEELHLLWLEDGDVTEDAAAVTIASSIAGAGVETHAPVESQVRMVAAQRGLLHIDISTLLALNNIDVVTIFTLPDTTPVDMGSTVAGVKVTPLAITGPRLREVIAVATSTELGRRVISVLPFLPLRLAAVVRQQLSDEARTRFEGALRTRAAWFGGSVTAIHYPADDPTSIGRALTASAAAADIVLAVGVASVDPLDLTWQSLIASGATPLRRGLPMHPGSSYWLAMLRGRPVIGVASCGMFARRSALDILFTRLHAGLPLDAAFLAGLGHGGLLSSHAAWRVPSYGMTLEDAPNSG